MEELKALLRSTLAESLKALSEEDRLAAAWSVASGRALAAHGRVVGYEGGVVRVEVDGRAWMREMMTLGKKLEHEMTRLSGVPLTRIDFQVRKPQSAQSKKMERKNSPGSEGPWHRS
jgi:predicted nucleic acid-binding Zn ribbon protein